MDRRLFILMSLYAFFVCYSCTVKVESNDNQETIINPYSEINWFQVLYVPSCSHEHGTSQSALDLLGSIGVKHIAFSNYYPSVPYYPLSEYFNVPDGVIASPNAEHHSITPFGGLHCNGLGSFFKSGSPMGENPVGMDNKDWRDSFDLILNNLQYEDGGGVTINHPKWSRWISHSIHPSVEDICQMLDYDSRVLGIEYYNSTCEYAFEEKVGWDIETWDAVLKTGRRCWGFSVADHRYSYSKERLSGLNILLCDSLDEHECLKAYREGRFYGAIYNTDLKFDSISLIDRTLVVSASRADFLCFVIDGEYSRINGNMSSIILPDDTIYVRVEAHNNDNSIYSNPILFKQIKTNL